MIADGDSVARNAFRVALREDTPLPIALSTGVGAGTTQELDANDILEVQDMAEAIARAEQIVRASRGTADLFANLGAPARRQTDDTAGPATPAPPSTFAPPPHVYASPDAMLRPLDATPHTTRTPHVMVPPVPTPMILPQPATEDDAYYHPAGRIRGLADVTLDGYRPEPTLLVRARTRRRSFSLILAAVLLPLVVLAAFAIFAREDVASAAATTAATTTSSVTVTAAPRTASTAAATLAVAPTTKAPPAKASKPAASGHDSVPVFDVNSLPPAGGRSKPHAR